MISDFKSTSGQALVEVCVCLVAIIVVLTALLQITSLCITQTNTMTEARRQAAELALQEAPAIPVPGYLETWEESSDGTRYTADDEAIDLSSTAPFYGLTVEKSVKDPGDWNVLAEHPNHISTLHQAAVGGPIDNPSFYFGMVKGEDSETVDLVSGFQKLIYRKKSITIDSEVWMTWTKGMY